MRLPDAITCVQRLASDATKRCIRSTGDGFYLNPRRNMSDLLPDTERFPQLRFNQYHFKSDRQSTKDPGR